MYELIKLKNSTYYIESPTKVGIYVEGDNAYLIDSGNDKEAAKKIIRILDEKSWKLKAIINTHSNGDHVGGNKYLQDKTGCIVMSTNIENIFIENTILESSFLYGGYPCKDLRNKFLMAECSKTTSCYSENFPKNLEIIPIKGHFFDMIGIKTPDNVVFIGDSLFGSNILNKYHIFFIYDIHEYLSSLDKLEKMEECIFVPSHSVVSSNISALIEENRNKIYEICEKITKICSERICFEDIFKKMMDEYDLVLDINQYVLVGSTIRSYLSYLYDKGKLKYEFFENKMYWFVNQ
ncbi:MAG: MBL fold metallo-hydrolase [Clostridia bacterium]|nr:MBL fold metallo-hydrolase [Clostridia bacterium]